MTLATATLILSYLVFSLALADTSGVPYQGLAQSSAKETDQDASEPGSISERVPYSLDQIPGSSNFYSPYAFVVDKKERTLSVWQQTGSGLKRVADFPAD